MRTCLLGDAMKMMVEARLQIIWNILTDLGSGMGIVR